MSPKIDRFNLPVGFGTPEGPPPFIKFKAGPEYGRVLAAWSTAWEEQTGERIVPAMFAKCFGIMLVLGFSIGHFDLLWAMSKMHTRQRDAFVHACLAMSRLVADETERIGHYLNLGEVTAILETAVTVQYERLHDPSS